MSNGVFTRKFITSLNLQKSKGLTPCFTHIHKALETMKNSLDLVAVYATCAVIPSILPK